MNLIPAIDLINGELVRLYKGDYDKKTVYNIDPLEVINEWGEIGVKRIHLVDLQGALLGGQKNLTTIKNITDNTNLTIQLGGGIRDLESCEKMIKMGVSKVIFGTSAITNPKEVEKSISSFGAQSVIVGVDVKYKKVQIKGWTEEAELTPEKLISDMKEIGVTQFMFTDVEKDGTLSDPNFKYMKELNTLAGHNAIVAGGISSLDHIEILKKYEIENIVIGKAIYEGQIDLTKALQL